MRRLRSASSEDTTRSTAPPWSRSSIRCRSPSPPPPLNEEEKEEEGEEDGGGRWGCSSCSRAVMRSEMDAMEGDIDADKVADGVFEEMRRLRRICASGLEGMRNLKICRKDRR